MKRSMKPGNMLYPVPVVLISCADKEGRDNLITVAWTGTICSDPAMLSISIRKERFSHHMISESGEFVVNLVTEDILAATDTCGVRTGAKVDKWNLTGLTKSDSLKVKAPSVLESPVNIECKVKETLELGSHDMFIAEIVAVNADESLFDENDKFDLNKAGLVAYSHGEYMRLGEVLGTFGYSVKKK